MRESRTYGFVRGVLGYWYPYRDSHLCSSNSRLRRRGRADGTIVNSVTGEPVKNAAISVTQNGDFERNPEAIRRRRGSGVTEEGNDRGRRRVSHLGAFGRPIHALDPEAGLHAGQFTGPGLSISLARNGYHLIWETRRYAS
jgi:hypothetical protein